MMTVKEENVQIFRLQAQQTVVNYGKEQQLVSLQ